MFICVTEVDSITKIPCTEEPMVNGPSMPNIEGLSLIWADKSTWPVPLTNQGVYSRAPRYYGICDDNADINLPGVLNVLSESEFYSYKQIEFEARKPFASWLWDELTGEWVAPIPLPSDAHIYGGNKFYIWDESLTSWVIASTLTGE